MKPFIFLLIHVLFLLVHKTDVLAQGFRPHVGANINFVSRTLSFSLTGIRVYGDVLLNEKLNLRTNLSANYHSIKNTREVTTLVNCVYTQVEESIIYLPNKNSSQIFYGGGIGYYSINNNEESGHLQGLEDQNLFVGNDNYDSNIGFHLLIGKDTGKLILEMKYTYTIFQHNQRRIGIIDSVLFDKIVSKNETFHFLTFSIGI